MTDAEVRAALVALRRRARRKGITYLVTAALLAVLGALSHIVTTGEAVPIFALAVAFNLGMYLTERTTWRTEDAP